MDSRGQTWAVTDRPELWVTRLGSVEYDTALALQHFLRDARVAGVIPDVLLLLEHPPVCTRGRRSADDELSFSADWYAKRGVAIRHADRGGKTTYHGPGQLVGYLIVDTSIVDRDVSRLVTAIEDSLIAALAEEGVRAGRDPSGRGVWTEATETTKLPAKIGSVGLHIAHGVTTHGLAINVNCDLEPFSWIRPCGLDTAVTSIAEVTGQDARVECVARRVVHHLTVRLGMRPRPVSRARLVAAAGKCDGATGNQLAFTA